MFTSSCGSLHSAWKTLHCTTFVDISLQKIAWKTLGGDAMRQGADSPREPLPALSLFSWLLMCLRRNFHSNTAMRTFVVIEVNEWSYPAFCIIKTGEALFPINDLRFQCTIDTFGDGIVYRVVVFCHTDTYAIATELVYIVITAVLYTSVRVMDQLS